MDTGKKTAVVSNVVTLMQAVYPRHTAKYVADVMGVSVATAKCWLERGVSASRRRELARKLLAEYDRQEQERAGVRVQLTELMGE